MALKLDYSYSIQSIKAQNLKDLLPRWGNALDLSSTAYFIVALFLLFT